jgi:tetratricopeptide (TPR) repeat protein
MRTSVDACPELEVIAAYLDGRLSERERAQVAAHVAGCETCYFVFTEAAQVRASNAPRQAVQHPTAGPTGSRWHWSPKIVWPSTAALAAAAALVLVATGVIPTRPAGSQELHALVAAVGSDRMFEPRLTGGFTYGPVRGAVRGSERSSETISPDVRIVAAQIEKQLSGKRSIQALRALAVAHLMTGNVARAVPVLEEAASQPGASADVLSDLCAAYLVRAERDGQPQDVARALTMADRAIALNPSLAEARFNRAYALERLSLRDAAKRAWAEYMQLDVQSGWAVEARLHFQQLSRERF